MKTYDDELFCDHCQRDTEHIVRDTGHERDSSQDQYTCTACKWYRYGLSGDYNSPFDGIIDVSNVSDEQLIDLIKFIGTLHQDGHRSYKSMAEEVRKYISETT